MFKKNFHKSLMAPLVFLGLLVSPWATDTRAGCPGGVETIFSVEDFCDVRCKDMSSIDISDRPNLPARLTFNVGTVWPEPNRMPPGCDPNLIMTEAMNPGLGVRALHQQGITGAGVSVAIIDQAMYLDHPEFTGKITTYYDLAAGEQSSMHGPAVTSLLVGTNCGTAPGARVYYCAVRSWVYEVDYAQALCWIIQQNESLTPSEKIRVVSVSAAPGHVGFPVEPGEPNWAQACASAEAAGILVLDCSDVRGFIGRCWYDPNDPENVAKCTPGRRPGEEWFDPQDILTPASLRTTAEQYTVGDFDYIYWSSAGPSWTRPYCAGVFAMGWQLRPELTSEQIVDYLFQTAYVNPDGAKIINPPAFISSLNTDKPVIGIDTAEINFYAVADALPESQILSISNGGLGTLNWLIDETCDWLQVSPTNGSSSGVNDINEVTLSVTELPPGTSTCQLTISDPCAINNPRTVTVELHVSGELHVPGEYPTIQAAIDDCNGGDTVIVAPGAYTGPGNRDLDFKGKAITVRSVDPNDPDIVAATIIDCNGSEADPHRGFYFHSNEDANSVLNGITISRGCATYGGGILCQHSSPSISNCVLVGNSSGSGINSAGAAMEIEDHSSPILVGCTITANSADYVGGGVRNHTSSSVLINCLVTSNSASHGGGMHNENSSSNPILINCTFSGNTATGHGGGIINAGPDPAASPVLLNCIFWDNSDEGGTDESAQIHGGTPVINYSCIQGWTGTLGGTGNFDADPSFADTTSQDPDEWDYHLKSMHGRWDPNLTTWVTDALTSPSVDAGDPGSDWTAELWPHGKRINMGAYGGTPQASMSPSNAGNIADLNHDNVVNYTDLMLFDRQWVRYMLLLPEDFDRNGIVDLADFAIIADNWLQTASP